MRNDDLAHNDDLLSESLRQQKPSEEKEEEERPSWKDVSLNGRKWLILRKHNSGRGKLVSGTVERN